MNNINLLIDHYHFSAQTGENVSGKIAAHQKQAEIFNDIDRH
jgi:hypothetical protein